MRPRLSVTQWFALANGALLIVGAAGTIGGFVALENLQDARQKMVDRLQPAIASALRLDTALLDQETSVRGFVLTGDPVFLEPYRRARASEPGERREILRLTGGIGLATQVRAAQANAQAWQTEYAEPTIETVRAGFQPGPAELRRGRGLFDAQRRTSTSLQATLERERASTRADLRDSARRVSAIFGAFAVALLLSLLATVWMLRRVVIVPLRALAERVREVAGGEFDHAVTADGAREVRQVAGNVDDMRLQILAERDELARSNAELEQFAYVASHDLQEPLRKIASFTQMLQRRYAGQLDERADTYIDFAVDGAKRMQDLINDLLAFSRVGRLKEPEVEIDCNVLAARAVRALDTAIEDTGAQVEVADLPTVRGEASLLALVFQNLIANGIKFHGEAEPRVSVTAARLGDEWQFTVADNGIGIEAEYADRIFVIFQRLHARTAYEGTGIGLAMCRKVVEYHGGRIWLDTETGAGATFHFTLPAVEEDA